MAKRRKSKQTNIEPSEMTLVFSTQSVGSGQTLDSYIDLSQAASIINRRFYRQGLNWAVAGFKFLTLGEARASITISKLPNSWVMSNSWEKGFRTWSEMNDRALEDVESVKGRFLDFKIYADSGHHQAGFAQNLLPANGGGVAIPGEWIPSEIRVPQTNGGSLPYEILATGGNYPGPGSSGIDAVSLIQGYANSRALPNITDPNNPLLVVDSVGTTPENWMSSLHNEGTSQDAFVVADVVEYDLPPYPFENDGSVITTHYPGGATQMAGLMPHDFANITASTIGGNTYLKGGNFPCGLIKITHTVENESISHNVAIIVDLVPGPHRGYMTEPMTEM